MVKRTDKLTPTRGIGKPCDHIKGGPANWPKGQLKKSAPPEAHLVQEIAIGFELKRKDRNHENLYALARQLKMSRNTLLNLIEGKTWPSAITIARLEICYGCKFWNNQHKLASKVKRPSVVKKSAKKP